MKERIENLVGLLNNASEAYYNGNAIMTNKDYDDMFDELVTLENETGIILSDSPTQRVGSDPIDTGLKKVKHEYPALSLDKTKDITKFRKVFNVRDKQAVVMWKLDGSTIQLTYNNGNLVLAATRGNGEIGSDITHNAPYIEGIPMTIPFKGKLVVRGEALMSYDEFNRINSLRADDDLYANARNLANATVSTLPNNDDIKHRKINFFAFKLVACEPHILPSRSFETDLLFLENNNFAVVEHELADVEADPLKNYKALENVMTRFSARVDKFNFPVDGLVVAANDVMYAEAQPGTEHNPNVLVGYALKWKDELAETHLRSIEYRTTRTGQISLVAVFDPVQLEGTTVERATLHNLNFLQEKLGVPFVGQKLWVYKANKIIPAIDHAEIKGGVRNGKEITLKADEIIRLPQVCPTCGSNLKLHTSTNDTKNLYCDNLSCASRKIQKFVHFCERDCMDIKGLSEAKISDLVSYGFVTQFIDFYVLSKIYHNNNGVIMCKNTNLADLEGWGDLAVKNLVQAIDKSAYCDFVNFIHAMGIPNVGKGQAKLLKKHLESIYPEWEDEMHMTLDNDGSYDLLGLLYLLECNYDYDFRVIDGFGEVINNSLKDWIDTYLINPTPKEIENFDDSAEIINLTDYLTFTDERPVTNNSSSISLDGKTFVITGAVNHFKNRDELKEKIEELGGKVTGSVSKNTNFLINNDITSTSGKNKKAKEIGVPIISEDDFLEMIS